MWRTIKTPIVLLGHLLLCMCVLSCTNDPLVEGMSQQTRGDVRLSLQIMNNTTGHPESRVELIRLLMFDARTGVCELNTLLRIEDSENLSKYKSREELQFDPVQIPVGVYDVVLLANEHSQITDLREYRKALQSIQHKMDLFRPAFTHIPYLQGEDQTYIKPQGPLLMSAQLEQVVVDRGSREAPFTISASLSCSFSLVEIAFENKVEQQAQGAVLQHSPMRVHRIKIKNILTHFSNPAQLELHPDLNAYGQIVQEINIPEEAYQQKEIASFQFYVPELIRSEKLGVHHPKTAVELAGRGFETSTFEFRNSNKHFEEDLRLDNRLLLPHAETPQLDFNQTNNLVRHVVHRVVVILGEVGGEVETEFEVIPWSSNESIRTYSGPKYSIELAQPVSVPQEHLFVISKEQPARFTIHLEEPTGAPWRISLTNALDFTLRPVAEPKAGHLGAFRGVVKAGTYYEFEVVPLKEFTGLPRYTELFLVIDGKEEQLIPELKEQKVPSGPYNRYKVKQVELL